MARTTVPYSLPTVNGSLADPAGTAVVAGAGNGGQVLAARHEQTLLRVTNAVSGTVTVLAGTQPLANASGQGPLAVAVGAGAVAWIGPFESARFEQSDGSLIVETTQATTITAFKVPRH